MSYLRFDKTEMIRLEESLQKEILRTNRAGAYHCSTIVGCNTRKYHGLLVIPIPEIDDENHVLLSSLDETVIQHGAEFNMGLHKYKGGSFSPKGHKYIIDFDCEKVPQTVYRVGGVILKKEIVFVHHENRILIRYTLVDAHSETTLRFKPFLAFRSVREYTHENLQANREYHEVDNGIKTCMYTSYPDLYMQFSKHVDFVFKPDWYRNIEYQKELERGYDFNEDLYVPGYFECHIEKGESIVFSAGTSEVQTSTLLAEFQKEADERTPRDSFKHCLINSAHQFYNRQGDEHYVLAGYPWFKCRARDLFVSLPGLTLVNNELDRFHAIMGTAEKAVRDFMAGNNISVKIYEMQHPDVLLWAIWALQQYSKFTSLEECANRYGKLVEDIMSFFFHQKHNNLFLHDNGLVYTDGKDEAVTWMNSTAYGRPVVPRTGYVVEFNALWYNAMRFAAEVCRATGNDSFADKMETTSLKTAESFVRVFLNEHGYLFDYVDNNTVDWSVRPNMLFAVAFDYSPLDKKQKRQVLDIVTKELLTPKGIRSLSPKSVGYNPYYVGPQVQRDYAYHQGTAWPWLMGFYIEAYLKIYKMSGLSFVERTLIGFESEMRYHCIGSISEMYDGNPPFRGRGAVSFAMNVAEVLRIINILDKYNNQQ